MTCNLPSMIRTSGSVGTKTGKPVSLGFKEATGISRVADTTEFNQRWWGLMDPQWCDEIYAACLEVNVRWDPKRLLFGDPDDSPENGA